MKLNNTNTTVDNTRIAKIVVTAITCPESGNLITRQLA